MCCFIVPLVETAAVSAIRKTSKEKTFIGKELSSLEKMLWGGSLMLVVDHIVNGELSWSFPFFTKLAENGFPAFLSELLCVGVPMALILTMAWLGWCLVKKHKTALVMPLLAFACISANAQTYNIRDYGVKPGDGSNARQALEKVLEASKGQENITVIFPKGRYDFYPNKYTMQPPYEAGIDLSGRKGVTIDGQGSEFIFHGLMMVSLINNAEDITMKNFSVDWDRPILSQCVVLNATDDYLEVYIDPVQYPHRLDGDKLAFLGEGWELPLMNMYETIFDSNGDVTYNTWDMTLGEALDKASVQAMGNSIYRFLYKPDYKPVAGSIVALYHRRYAVQGISANRSKNIWLENLTFYHTGCGGIWAGMCENVTLKHFDILPNRQKGRAFSLVADGAHFNMCKGLIHFDGCTFNGQGDDFCNIHGRNVKIDAFESGNVLKALTKGSECYLVGDSVAIVSQKSGQRELISNVSACETVSGADGSDSWSKVTLEKGFTPDPDDQYYLESITWSASLIIENCKILKGSRARGTLATTPRPVLIQNNYFHTAGTAILMEGDLDYWFESGGNVDVIIRNNVFDNCLSSGNRDGDRWQWGDAIITITPSHLPATDTAPAYHKNIKIYDNIFCVFDTPLVRAKSVDGLMFKNNQIIKTYQYKPYTYYKDSFTLEGCRNVKISGNKIDPRYEVRTISTTLMKPSDVKAKGFTTK